MKRFSKILLSLLCIIGFTANVYAATSPTSISVSNSGTRYEYVNGLPIYYVTAGGYNLYVLNSGTYFDSKATLTDPQQANNGFAYIVNNSNVTSSSYKNYYIASVAILWYQDYLNGNDANISTSLKNYITSNSNDTVCYYINKLVNNAKNYGNNGNSIRFLDKEITFTKNGSYYYSNVIDVETYNLNSNPSVKLYNAPTSASIINNTVAKNGTGSFQIRIPASSLTNFTERDFEVYITAGNSSNTVYKYSNYGIGEAVYGRTYSTSNNNIEASMPANIKGIGNTKVRINVLDNRGNNISGLSYSIYSGNCVNSTCYSDDLVQNFTTRTTYTELNNILSSGTYTLVNRSNNTSYNLQPRVAFNVDDNSSIQTVNIEEDNYYNGYNGNNNNYDYNYDYNYNNYNYNNSNYYSNNKNYKEVTYRKVNIYNNINDSKDIIKIYSISNKLQASFRSNETNYEINLTEGTYYLYDTDNKLEKIYFQITTDGDLLVKYNDEYIRVNYINLDYKNNISYVKDDFNDDKITKKYDKETNTYYIDGIDGLTSIEITNDVNTTTDVKVEWLSNIIDCPITSLDATIKYIIGAITLSSGAYLVFRNVKKNKNSI